MSAGACQTLPFLRVFLFFGKTIGLFKCRSTYGLTLFSLPGASLACDVHSTETRLSRWEPVSLPGSCVAWGGAQIAPGLRSFICRVGGSLSQYCGYS